MKKYLVLCAISAALTLFTATVRADGPTLKDMNLNYCGILNETPIPGISPTAVCFGYLKNQDMTNYPTPYMLVSKTPSSFAGTEPSESLGDDVDVYSVGGIYAHEQTYNLYFKGNFKNGVYKKSTVVSPSGNTITFGKLYGVGKKSDISATILGKSYSGTMMRLK